MDRLLVLRLESSGCAAEAIFNGVPLLRVDGRCRLAWMAVHEYTLAGANALSLVLQPGPATLPPGAPALAPAPQLSDGTAWATLRLLLPRMGASASPTLARTLGQIDWAPPANDIWEAPLRLDTRVEMPAGFPRWRWLDAPVISDPAELRRDAAAFLRDIAVGLARGNPEPLVQASRLRLEDFAQAYQQALPDVVARLRQHIVDLHAIAALQPALPSADTLALRSVAGGRMVECLGLDGAPFLRSVAEPHGPLSWPLRLAAIDGRFYVLR
ncbi:MAG: hypothetical protein RIQ60_2801 [Pseudomonadota bacterium]|jgi:hypothetical protein